MMGKKKFASVATNEPVRQKQKGQLLMQLALK
jgi:hypothetical protein